METGYYQVDTIDTTSHRIEIKATFSHHNF